MDNSEIMKLLDIACRSESLEDNMLDKEDDDDISQGFVLFIHMDHRSLVFPLKFLSTSKHIFRSAKSENFAGIVLLPPLNKKLITCQPSFIYVNGGDKWLAAVFKGLFDSSLKRKSKISYNKNVLKLKYWEN